MLNDLLGKYFAALMSIMWLVLSVWGFHTGGIVTPIMSVIIAQIWFAAHWLSGR